MKKEKIYLKCLFTIFIFFFINNLVSASGYILSNNESYGTYNMTFTKTMQESSGLGKSGCDDNKDPNFAYGDCYLEHDQRGNAYYSLMPAFNSYATRHIVDAPEGGKYIYIAIGATLNYCNSGSCGVGTPKQSAITKRDDIVNALNWSGYGSEIENGFTIEDVFQLMWWDNGWNFWSQTSEKNLLEEAEDGIEFSVASFFAATLGDHNETTNTQADAANFWMYESAGIVPAASVTFNESTNSVITTIDSSVYGPSNASGRGINIHSHHDNARFSTRVWSPFVLKIHVEGSDNNSCTIENGKYFGTDGVEITTDINYPWYQEHLSDYNNDEENYKQSVFVDLCLCNTTNGTNSSANKKPTYSDELYNSLGDIAKNYFDEHCKSPEIPHLPSGNDHNCTPTIKDTSCETDVYKAKSKGGEGLNTPFNEDGGTAGDPTTFSIGDDPNCVFSTENVGGDTYSSDSTHNDLTNYTHLYNEYCSLTCAEQIDFKLPGVESAIAGRYWSWEQADVTLKGTRTCKATVHYDNFEKNMGINITGNLSDISSDTPTRMATIYKNGEKVPTDSNTPTIGYDTYGVVRQLRDLHDAYVEYENATGTITGSKNYNHTISCAPPPGCEESCTDTCTEYTFTSEYTGETFYRYESSNHSACSYVGAGFCKIAGCPTEFETLNGNTISTSIDVFEELYSEKYPIVDTAIADVRTCSEELKETVSTWPYEFRPMVSFNYDDNYNSAFNNRKIGSDLSDPNVSEETTSPTVEIQNIDKNMSNIYFYDDISDTNITAHSFYTRNSNHTLVWTNTKKYMLAPYFWAYHNQINKWLLNSSESKNNMDNVTNYGQIYPISLSTEGGRYNYTISFKRLGVHREGTTNLSNGRFDRLIIDSNSVPYKHNNTLDYACKYDVENDITNPNKPEFFFRNISLNNFDPNKRQLGKNWTNDKGKATICEMNPEPNVYINGSLLDCDIYSSKISPNNVPEDAYETPQYHFQLTPENMYNIRQNFNHSKENSGGYSDFDVELYEGGISKADGSTYSGQGWWYKSKFLEKLKNDNSYAKEADFETKFEAWDTYETGSGVGPAWK